MSKEIDIQFVREAYQKMSDGELIRILTQDAAGLTPEAQEVVKEEIRQRNLDPNIKSIKAIRINLKSKKTNNVPFPSDYLRTFVLSKIGEIETYKDNKEKLLQLIS